MYGLSLPEWGPAGTASLTETWPVPPGGQPGAGRTVPHRWLCRAAVVLAPQIARVWICGWASCQSHYKFLVSGLGTPSL